MKVGEEKPGVVKITAAPHVRSAESTTRIMWSVVLSLLPVIGASILFFGPSALLVLLAAVAGCLVTERLFGDRSDSLADGSAMITGLLLGLCLPAGFPLWMAFLGGVFGIGFGKIVFGGLGQNIFNPAMVGRAFVMVSFAGVMGGAAYTRAEATRSILTQATPLSAAKEAAGELPALWPLLVGNTNGSLGETSVLACLLGGLYLCWRRSASWQTPVAVLVGAAAAAAVAQLVNPATPLTVLHHLAAVHHQRLDTAPGHHPEIVGDEDHPHVEFLLNRSQKSQNLGLNGYIKGGGRFIGDDQRRAAHQSHGNHDPLPQTTRKLMRVLI